MKKTNLVTFVDLLRFTEANFNMGWNDANQLLVDDEVPPMHGETSKEIEYDDIGCYCWSNVTQDILKSFMTKNKIKKMVLID